MPFVVLKGEKTLSDVVSRAFGELKAADATRARAAVLKANPHLTETAGLEPGVIVVVPGVPGLSTAPPDKSETPAGQAVVEIGRGLEDYRKTLTATARDEQAVISDLTAVLKSKEMKALVKQLPDAGKYVEHATAAARARATEHEERVTFLRTLAKAQADLDALAAKLG
jgi:hypothetical protein